MLGSWSEVFVFDYIVYVYICCFWVEKCGCLFMCLYEENVMLDICYGNIGLRIGGNGCDFFYFGWWVSLVECWIN